MAEALCLVKPRPFMLVVVMMVLMGISVSCQPWRGQRYNPWNYNHHNSRGPKLHKPHMTGDTDASKQSRTYDQQATGQLYVRVPGFSNEGSVSHVVHGKPHSNTYHSRYAQHQYHNYGTSDNSHKHDTTGKTESTVHKSDANRYSHHQDYKPAVSSPPKRPAPPAPHKSPGRSPHRHTYHHTPHHRPTYGSRTMRKFKNMDQLKSGRGSFHFKSLHGKRYGDHPSFHAHYPSSVNHGSHYHDCEGMIKDPHHHMDGAMKKYMCDMYFKWGDAIKKPNPMPLTAGQKEWIESLGDRRRHSRRKRQADSNVDDRAVRREYRFMPDDERERFHTAARGLKNSYMDGRSKYDIVVGYHQASAAPGAHFGPGFLGYHRELLFRGYK